MARIIIKANAPRWVMPSYVEDQASGKITFIGKIDKWDIWQDKSNDEPYSYSGGHARPYFVMSKSLSTCYDGWHTNTIIKKISKEQYAVFEPARKAGGP